MKLSEVPHRRYNPLLDEWVLCSPQRLKRPWQGQVEASPPESLPAYDPECYLCPGNLRAEGARNPAYSGTFIFDNDFPALLPSAPALQVDIDELLVAHTETGCCRVLCFSPRHDLTVPLMSQAEIRGVLDAWAGEVSALAGRDDIGYVQVFENKGAAMGCSNPHPHCQIWATRHVPRIPAQKDQMQRRYLAVHDHDLLGDYLARELSEGERLVCQNEHWVALVPFWAVWPFETMLVPRRRVASLPGLTSEEREAGAEIIRRLTTRYDNLFQCPFPYSMGWHAQPTDGADHPHWRLHAVYVPPLLRSATVRKFLVGYEMTAEPQRDLTAELAAARLRDMPERHYREAV